MQSLKHSWTVWAGLSGVLLSPSLISDVFFYKGIESLNNILMHIWKQSLSYAICELRKITLKNSTANAVLERGESISCLVIPMAVPTSLSWCSALCLMDCPGLAGGQGSGEWDHMHYNAGATSPIN